MVSKMVAQLAMVFLFGWFLVFGGFFFVCFVLLLPEYR